MELRAYVDIIRRRWLAIVLLPTLVLVLVAYLDRTRSPVYTAEARISVSKISDRTSEGRYEFDDYYDLLSTDFLADDLTEVVRGNVFAAAVAQRLNDQGIAISSEEVDSALSGSREHRILTITASAHDHGRAVVIANAAAVEIDENFHAYAGPETFELPITVRPVQVPIEAEADTQRMRLTYLLAVIVAAGFGLLLALLLEYLDDSLPNADAARAATGLELLGVVPGDAR